MCLCLRESDNKAYTFTLQWHITAKCDQKCRHCYMYDSPSYSSELENELSFEQCKSIIDDFVYTLKLWNRKGTLILGGGDPILRNDFFDILKYIKESGDFPVVVMGNSYHLDKPVVKKMKQFGVLAYQISLDGLRETHDFFRKPGSFSDTIRGYELLKDEGISPLCMFTVSKVNKDDLIPVIRLAAELRVAAFDFDRLVPMGAGNTLKDEIIPPLEYRELLLQVKDEYTRLRKSGIKTQFGYKDNLWELVSNENSWPLDLAGLPEGYELSRGCLIGAAGLAVLADGNVMACRRLPIVIGKVPEQKINDIFNNTPILNELRNANIATGTDGQEYFNRYKGCRAVAYGVSGGNYYAGDPQCWI